MKIQARVSCHPDVAKAIDALRVALTTHHHVGDFAYSVEIAGYIIGAWDGRRVETAHHAHSPETMAELAEQSFTHEN